MTDTTDSYVMVQPRADGKWAVQLGTVDGELDPTKVPDPEAATADELFGDIQSAVARAKELAPDTSLGLQVTDATIQAYSQITEGEEALIRVYKAMQLVGIPRELGMALVTAMQSEGILFRLRAGDDGVVAPEGEGEDVEDAGDTVGGQDVTTMHGDNL